MIGKENTDNGYPSDFKSFYKTVGGNEGINVITPLVLTSMVKDVTMTVPIVMPNPYLHSANCEMPIIRQWPTSEK